VEAGVLALDLKKLPVLTLSADGVVTAWNAEWDDALGKADWSGLQLPLAKLLNSERPVADDLEFDLHPIAPGRRRALLQPAFAADGSLMEWLVYLLPLPSGRSDQELIGSLPLRTLMGFGSNHFLVADEVGKLVLWNRQVELASGRSAEILSESSIKDLFTPSERGRVDEILGKAIMHEGETQIEANLRTPDGPIPYLFWASRFKCEGKHYMVSIGIDIARRRRDEQILRLRERALHATTNGIVITRCMGSDNPIEYVNPAFETITGYKADEVLGRDSRFMGVPGLDDLQRDQLREAIRDRQKLGVVMRNRRKNGEIFWNALNITPVADERGMITHYVGVLNDVTASQQRTSILEHEVNHDALTGLANRTLLWDRLELALSVAQRNKTLVATLLLDLNKFKQINDTLGHEAGDEVLKVVARRLQASVRESDTVARLGGDEFVLVLANQPSLRFTLRMVQRIRSDMAKPVIFDSKEISVAGSIGVSVYPHDGATAFDLVRAADTAMYHAKASGGKEVHFFSPAMKSVNEAKQKLETDLRRGIDHDELFLMFQPRMCLRTGNIIGIDALLRWRHPELGILLPSAFLNDAEENGLIIPIGQLVLEKVCRALQQYKSMGLPQLPLSMKATYREFVQENFLVSIADRLLALDVAPSSFELDVRESHIMRNPHLGRQIATQSAELGIHLGVDDVGDGDSNLSFLHHLQLHHIKMARAPVQEISSATGQGPFAKSIIDLAHNLGIRVIAKAVETADQSKFLGAQGCDELQGYFFCAPVQQEELEGMLAQNLSINAAE
jgi:diguanylate cyclase (GGDEF)-like protein/PAS domain S-box-containing protein